MGIWPEGLTVKQVTGDKGEKFIESTEKTGAEAVFPPPKGRGMQREYDQHRSRQRNQIERLFGRLKQCHRVATNDEKPARNDIAFLHLAATMIVLV